MAAKEQALIARIEGLMVDMSRRFAENNAALFDLAGKVKKTALGGLMQQIFRCFSLHMGFGLVPTRNHECNLRCAIARVHAGAKVLWLPLAGDVWIECVHTANAR